MSSGGMLEGDPSTASAGYYRTPQKIPFGAKTSSEVDSCRQSPIVDSLYTDRNGLWLQGPDSVLTPSNTRTRSMINNHIPQWRGNTSRPTPESPMIPVGTYHFSSPALTGNDSTVKNIIPDFMSPGPSLGHYGLGTPLTPMATDRCSSIQFTSTEEGDSSYPYSRGSAVGQGFSSSLGSVPPSSNTIISTSAGEEGQLPAAVSTGSPSPSEYMNCLRTNGSDDELA